MWGQKLVHKVKSLKNKKKKNLCKLWRPHLRSDTYETWSECLPNEFLDKFEIGSCWVEN